jgi:hypothetical protein
VVSFASSGSRLLGPRGPVLIARGDREAAAALFALNAVFQVVMFAALGWLYLSVLPGWLGLQQSTISTSPGKGKRVEWAAWSHPGGESGSRAARR